MSIAAISSTSVNKTKLYTPALLKLAVSLADYPLVASYPFKAEARSRICGSVVAVSLVSDRKGCVTAVGIRASACAVGQAAAALFARAAIGREAASIGATRAQLANWLNGAGAMPDWPDLDMLSATLPYTGRHSAILLPWEAAVQALSIEPEAD